LRPYVLKGGGTGARNAGGTLRRPIPAEPDATMQAIAAEHGWDADRVEDEYREFVAWNRAKGTSWPDWTYPWRRWVKQGIKRDERQRQTRSVRSISGTSMVDTMLARAADVAKYGWAA
jgi:hypothetical protein